LKKKVKPDVFTSYLKELGSWIEDRKYVMTGNQFILHVVNNFTEDYITQGRNLGEKDWIID
jgi:hypothetical protein